MEEYIASNYIARFSKLNSINFQKENVRQIKNGFKIVSTVLKLKKDDVNIDYLLSKNDGEWKIFDVLLDNSVSEVATKKSEFSNFISGENIDKLISALKKKNNQLKIEWNLSYKKLVETISCFKIKFLRILQNYW